ncbi:MAG TPA: xanthine dehydrogenase accessory protein XdhC [Casimicrobiaceae bacterium]|nr:xanthine dehydrogenase accessory protein XdhC [Casimicrobiaceae bacterium]
MIDWIASLRAALAAEQRAVLVTVAATRGSVPREAGARLIATARSTAGTIGGGHLEYEAVRIAREAIDNASGGAWLARFPLAARLGQCCGGVATLLFRSFDADAQPTLAALAHRVESGEDLALATAVTPERSLPVPVAPDAPLPPAVIAASEALRREPGTALLVEDAGTSWFLERAAANDFRIVVFGNGHVGRALAQVLGALPCAVTWVDTREEDFPPSIPTNVAVVATDVPEAEVRAAPSGSMFLVMTHSHALDFELVAAVLARRDFAYVGMIGSAAKRAQLERRLRERGLDAAAIGRVVCPIGIGGIAGRDPGVIAVAVAAELLQERERASAAQHAGRPRSGESRR